MGWRSGAGLVAVGGLSALTLVGCGSPKPWQSELVSVNVAGDDSGDQYSTRPAFSPDGTKIAFESGASDLGPTDTNDDGDIYVRDLATGTTTLISHNAAGTDSGNKQSGINQLGPATDVFAFTSLATDLVPGDANPASDVFVHDPASGVTTLASAAVGSAQSANGFSLDPVLSPDGNQVAFNSQASNLVANDTNNSIDVFLHDLVTGATTLVSVKGATPTSTSPDPDPSRPAAPDQVTVFQAEQPVPTSQTLNLVTRCG